jgi:hypothetical protein
MRGACTVSLMNCRDALLGGKFGRCGVWARIIPLMRLNLVHVTLYIILWVLKDQILLLVLISIRGRN